MEIKLPFHSPSPTAWRSAGSGVLVGVFAYWLATGGFGFGALILLSCVLVFLTLRFSEWRRMQYSLYALILVLGTLFMRTTALFPPLADALTAGVLSSFLFLSAAARSDPRRIAPRVLSVMLTFLAALFLFKDPSLVTFAVFALTVAFTARDEARLWSALRVGEGRLVGAAIALFGAELAAIAGLLPLGPVRTSVFMAFTLLMVREGLGEAYQGNLRPTLVFQGLAVLFTFSVLLFASVPWVL